MKASNESILDPRVAIAELPSPAYSASRQGEDEISSALHRAAQSLQWADDARGPLGKVIHPGARVLVKPNLVLHENRGPWGIEPLVTHPSLIQAAVEAALSAGASEVMVGDAPIQGCDFERLLASTGLDQWAEQLMKREPRFKGIRDFRRTTCELVDGVRVASENRQSEDRFVLFDLGCHSLLEPITDGNGSFRVTCYDPQLMARTHAPGRHQYLVARDVIDADVIVNLPKLKTHKKAGVTCALKNLIGINGNKEYLPHHRIGGAEAGGDCYPGQSQIKRALEFVYDQQNSSNSFSRNKLWNKAVVPLYLALRLTGGDKLGVEGAWSGNDTIWRTCLDLNRILLYGRSDGTLADEPQRTVVHLVDAVIAGQGDGPLAPQPLPLGLLLAGRNAAAIDYVGAHLLAYNPANIPISDRAFEKFDWPIALFKQHEILLTGDWESGAANEMLASRERQTTVLHPEGWRSAAKSCAAAAASHG